MAISQRIGWRSYVSPLSSLLTSIYGVWNGESTSNTLDTSIFSAWNGEVTNNKAIKNAWNANGNAIDSKSGTNGTIVTPNSTTGYTTSSMTYSTGKLGSSAFTFNGSNFVNLPTNTFTFTNDFTVGCWFFVPTNYVSNAYLVSAFDNKNSYPSYFGWWIGYDSTNKKINFGIGDSTQGSYGNVNLSTANNTITPGQWNHVMVTRKRSTRSRIYINGVLSNSNTNTVNPNYNQGFSSIGSNYFAFSYPFWTAANAGLKIDAVHTWESELDQPAVTELYNSGNGQEYPFTISDALVPSFNDAAGTNNGTRPDTTLTNWVAGPILTTGKIGNAFKFDGINDFIQLPNNSMNFTGDFSISAWLYFPTTIQLIGSDYGHILSNWTAVTWTSNLAGWRFDTAGNAISFTTYNGTSTTVSLGAPGMGLDRSGWRHVAFTRTGTEYKLWLDGGQYTATSTTMLVPKYQGTIIPKIGRLGDSTMGGWDSYSSSKILIDAVTVWQKALTADDILQLYNAGEGVQYPFAGKAVPSLNDAVGTNHGTRPTSTLTGGVLGPSFTTGKIGQAFTFDGINDYVALPNNSLNFPSTSFSVSFWVNLANITSGNYALVSNYANDGVNRGWIVGSLTSGKLYFGIYSPSIQETITSATIAINTWYHVTCVYTPNQPTKTYINGTLDSTSSTSANPSYITTHYPSIGASKYNSSSVQQYVSNGTKIDAVSIWNRALTATEVTSLYNSGNGKQYPNY
jgi:hypothetical protein